MLKKHNLYSCDHCGKVIPQECLTNFGNRFVGIDGDLMIHIAVKRGEYQMWKTQYRTVLLCPKCWVKVFKAVRRVLKMNGTERTDYDKQG